MMQGKIALEEHFFLPSFGAYGADPSPLDGAIKAHNYHAEYFASKSGCPTRRCGLRIWIAVASSAWSCH